MQFASHERAQLDGGCPHGTPPGTRGEIANGLAAAPGSEVVRPAAPRRSRRALAVRGIRVLPAVRTGPEGVAWQVPGFGSAGHGLRWCCRCGVVGGLRTGAAEVARFPTLQSAAAERRPLDRPGRADWRPPPPCSPQSIAAVVWLLTAWAFLADSFASVGGEGSTGVAEVWPYQWRIAAGVAVRLFHLPAFHAGIVRFPRAGGGGTHGTAMTLVGAIASASEPPGFSTKSCSSECWLARRRFDDLDWIFFPQRQAGGLRGGVGGRLGRGHGLRRASAAGHPGCPRSRPCRR